MKIEKVPLTLCVIARNEAANLKRCFRNISDVAGEIILLDTGSTDGTPEIANAHGALVYNYEWDNDFGAARNFLLEKAAGDWVLWLDADEYVPAELAAEIAAAVSAGGDTAGYYIARKNFYFGRWLRYGRNFPDYQMKLYKKSASSGYTGSIHEKITVTGRLGKLKNAVEHYPYNTIDEYFEKFGAYVNIEAKRLYDSGVRVSLFNTVKWIIVKPAVRFFRRYILYGGFLNGFPGLFAAFFDVAGYIGRYIKLWEIQKNQDK